MRALLCIVLSSLLAIAQPVRADDLRTEVVTQLKRSGSNVQRPHKFDFYLYLPTEAEANRAAQALGAQGLSTQVRRAAKGSTWLCLASGVYVPDGPKLTELGHLFSSLAEKHRGEFDGWEAEVAR
jgi:hypothetical protein